MASRVRRTSPASLAAGWLRTPAAPTRDLPGSESKVHGNSQRNEARRADADEAARGLADFGFGIENILNLQRGVEVSVELVTESKIDRRKVREGQRIQVVFELAAYKAYLRAGLPAA